MLTGSYDGEVSLRQQYTGGTESSNPQFHVFFVVRSAVECKKAGTGQTASIRGTDSP